MIGLYELLGLRISLLWGHRKEYVYAIPPRNVWDLVARIF
jgi:hypothetical protein